MNKKHLLAAAGAVAAAAAILAAVWLGRAEEKSPALSGQRPTATRPPVTQPVQTRPTETTEMPETTEPPVPETTEPPVLTEPEQTEEVTVPTEPEETIPELFPMELEGGRLTVHSLFPYSGMNPDAALDFGEDIAGLQLTNTSSEHLALAELTAVLEDGTALTFRVEDLPPGMSAMVFDPGQTALTGEWRCAELYGFAEFEEEDPLRPELVSVSTEGMVVTLQNVSGRDLTNLRVACHGLLDGSAFGGTTYVYDVASLPAGGSAVVYAVDCILGMAQAVRVEMGD